MFGKNKKHNQLSTLVRICIWIVKAKTVINIFLKRQVLVEYKHTYLHKLSNMLLSTNMFICFSKEDISKLLVHSQGNMFNTHWFTSIKRQKVGDKTILGHIHSPTASIYLPLLAWPSKRDNTILYHIHWLICSRRIFTCLCLYQKTRCRRKKHSLPSALANISNMHMHLPLLKNQIERVSALPYHTHYTFNKHTHSIFQQTVWWLKRVLISQ